MTTALSDGATIQIGKHRFTREGALLKITSDGETTLEQTYQLVAHLQAIFDEYGYVLILGDMTNGKGLQADARKVASKWGQTYGVHCRTAVIGAAFGVRTVIALMNRATNLLTRTPVYLEFFATEEEALCWLRAEKPIVKKGVGKDAI